MAKMTKQDIRIEEITMQLVHYFITKENYQPVLVNGSTNEIWLENNEKKYEVIRINYNYIHNNEQLGFDIFKTKSVLKQIKKKTFSINAKALTILLNAGENVKVEKEDKTVSIEIISNLNNIYKDNNLLTIFPELENDYVESSEDVDPYINCAIDINKKTEERNQLFEKIFTKKKPMVTYFMGIFLFILFLMPNIINHDLLNLNVELIKSGEWYRLFTTLLVHGDICVLACVVYTFSMLGTEIETTMGHLKTFIIFIVSSIMGGLFTAAIYPDSVMSIGTIGGSLGILGGVLYVGYNFRPYLSSIIKSKIVPVIIMSALLLMVSKDVAFITMFGGLISGIFTAMILGIKGKSDYRDRINGIVVSSLLLVFLIFMIIK